MMDQTAYLAPFGLEEMLQDELTQVTHRYDRLFLAQGSPQKVHWAQNVWLNPQIIPFQSISDGAKKLSALNKLWAFYPYQNIRRAKLITEQLPYFSPKPLTFPASTPTAPLGSWTLLDSNTILASPQCESSFAHGEVHFIESKEPPSRAYLKLWEFFVRTGHMPQPGQKCLELGASPGSWTWVLHQLGSYVTAVDRAPLADKIASLPRVISQQKDAFSILPCEMNEMDWILSDVVCYPEKLLQFVRKSLDAGVNANWVCTLKFQGKIDSNVIREFEMIPNSRIIHLFHNKHELTWYL